MDVRLSYSPFLYAVYGLSRHWMVLWASYITMCFCFIITHLDKFPKIDNIWWILVNFKAPSNSVTASCCTINGCDAGTVSINSSIWWAVNWQISCAGRWQRNAVKNCKWSAVVAACAQLSLILKIAFVPLWFHVNFGHIWIHPHENVTYTVESVKNKEFLVCSYKH